MNDDRFRNNGTPKLDTLPPPPSETPAREVSGESSPQAGSIFDVYPRHSDVEVLGALRYLMEVEGVEAAAIEGRAGLEPGTVDAILTGRRSPSVSTVRKMCWAVRMSPWMFFLFGTIQYGAELGLPEMQWLLEERRRMLAENPEEPIVELVAEATRLLFRLGRRPY